MIRKLVELIKYEEHLRKTQQDWQSRWENVQELITFASEIEKDVASKAEQQQSHEEDQVESEIPPEKWVLRMLTHYPTQLPSIQVYSAVFPPIFDAVIRRG
jgi:DNA helicase-2/ATP-dependent DNA helicase PcrA